MVCVVCPSVRLSVRLSLANISESKRDRLMVIRKLEWESEIPDSESAIRFAIWSTVPLSILCFRVTFSYKLHREDGTTLGTVAGQLSSRPITDDTLFR